MHQGAPRQIRMHLQPIAGAARSA